MRRDLAQEAANIIAGARNDSYGSAAINLARIAKLWGAYLGAEITASDVGKMMTLLKISRSRHKYDTDNYLDGIAYLLLAEELDHGTAD